MISNDSFDRVPVLNYSHITNKIESMGKDKCLLQEEDFQLLTSGSTDVPKRLYYTWNDIRRSAQAYHDLFRHIGFQEDFSVWEMSAWIPFMSGPLSRCIMETFFPTNEIVFSSIVDQKDMSKAFKKISKGRYRFDIVSMPVLFFYILSQVLDDPDFIRDVVGRAIPIRLPSFLIRAISGIASRGIDPEKLKTSISETRFIVCSAASMGPYLSILDKMFPKAEKIDLWASTENACMGLRPPGATGHYLLVEEIVPELITNAEARKMSDDPSYVPKTFRLQDWTSGMKGELVITRDGDCLPLLRYRTGDEIEVLKQLEDDPLMGPFQGKPLVRLLGRTADKMDFFDPEQWGPYHGDEIHFSDIDNVLAPMGDVEWWELYATRELPRRLVLTIVSEKESKTLEDRILDTLLEDVNESTRVFPIAHILGELNIIVMGRGAFVPIQEDIDRLSEERGASRVKPRRMFIMRDVDDIREHLMNRYGIDILEARPR